MAWTTSSMFVEWPKSVFGGGGASSNAMPTTYAGLVTTDTVRVALYSAGTPDNTALYSSTGYNTGQWATANQSGVTDANWLAAGQALGSKAATKSTNVFTFTGANTSGAGNVTLASAVGCLVYDDAITAGTVADQGICYNYFGGAQSVTAGTFTIVWNASGIFTITCT